MSSADPRRRGVTLTPNSAPPPEGRFGPAEFARWSGVSRETMARLEAYVALLEKWQRSINLVGGRTLDDVWRRHILDSAQLQRWVAPGRLIDLGSGAGFPGLVLAILTGVETHLVESDARKCAFLREAARVTGAEVIVHNQRIETIQIEGAQTVTARALAPLDELCSLAARFVSRETVCLFLKGQDIDSELTGAHRCWRMTTERYPSLSDKRGVVLRITELRHVDQRI